MKRPRPHYGNAFEYDRILNVFFYTSNTEKLLQARLLFMRHGYELKHFRGKKEPYDEDYELGTIGLLNRAIEQVNEEFGVRSIFFVEDTSVRIESLSTANDFPGLAVKEWFSQTTFETLDEQLHMTGDDRRTKVNSDIALYIPTLQSPLIFHGETVGKIAHSPPFFEASVQYPWLTPKTFNGWIIPDGSAKRLGEMEFEESLHYDFRAKALKELLTTLENFNAAINLRPNFYVTRKSISSQTEQLSLIPEPLRVVLLVIGARCSGKTTFSDYMAKYESVRVYEASTVLRGIAQDVGVILGDSEEALVFLKEAGWDCVARKIADYIDKVDCQLSVVTGLRTPEEILLLKRRFSHARIVLIDADPRIRFERHIRRARDGALADLRVFSDEDEKQKQFGTLRIANDIAEVTIYNDGTRNQYSRKIEEVIDLVSTKPKAAKLQPNKSLSELHRSLRALLEIGTSATCESISALTAKLGLPVRKYNTNRALKAVPEFADRIERKGEPLRYEPTSRSIGLLHLLDLLTGRGTE
jgi:inosine/xanthosine triphosphate pyrophosphatase family protein/dephospho-CoA kinase